MDALPGFTVLPEVDGVIWGLDPSSKRVSLAVLEPGNRLAGGTRLHIRTATLSQISSRSDRFHEGYLRQVEMFRAWVDGGYKPEAIYLEEPYVPRRQGGAVTHLFMYGVTLAALGAVCPDVPFVEIPPQTWKAKALGTGHGRAEKPEILRWAQALGYEGRLQDEADALGVVVAGAVMRALPSAVAA